MNAAVDDAASMAEDVARVLSAARSKGRLTTAERKRAQALMISVAVSAPLERCITNHTYITYKQKAWQHLLAG